MAHAYFVVNKAEEGINEVADFARDELKVSENDLVTLRYLHFSVEEARSLSDIASASSLGEHKVVIVATTRFFHEAQNALLKLFEEPPPEVTLILVIPSEGILLPTLRSRLMPLPNIKKSDREIGAAAEAFLSGTDEEREKFIAKLVDRSKSDKEEEKQEARTEAVRLAEDLLRAAGRARKEGGEGTELRKLIEDLHYFLPLLHTRSAPLKLIFEHLLIVIPKSLYGAKV